MNNKKVEDVVIDKELLNSKPDELKHYGVLGMRWGKRKKQENALVVVGPKSKKNKEIVEPDDVIDAKFKDVKKNNGKDKKSDAPIEVEVREKNTTSNNTNKKSENKQTSEMSKEEIKEHNKDIGKQIGKLNQEAKVATGISKVSEEAGKVTKVLGKIDNDKRVNEELNALNNDELRKINDRLRLERDYKDLNKDRMAKGYDVVHKTFNLAVPVAAFVGASLSAYAQYKELFKK